MLDSVNFSISPTTAIFTFLVIIAALFLNRNLYRYFTNPGPWGVPIFGFYPFIRKDFHVHLSEMIPKYGDLFLFSMGGKPLLHVGSHRALREMVIKNADNFPGRSSENVILHTLFEGGLVFINDTAWRVWRKFVGQSMRELGINPKELKGPMLDSVEATLKIFKESQGKSLDLCSIFSFGCSEVVRRLMLGDEISIELAKKINEIYIRANYLMAEPEMLLSGFFAKYLILPFQKSYRDFLKAKYEMDNILQDIINQHRRNFDPNHPRDIIDLYLKERKNREEKKDSAAKYFTDKALLATLAQMYGDGGQVTGNFVVCYLKDLALRLDVQNAIYEEIEREIGIERMVVYEDREKLPYTNSVLREIERTSNFFPVVPSLESNCDMTVGNIFIPKGTIIVSNQYAIHNDPSVYKNPKQFDETRFMSTSNSKEMPDMPVTFGIGKRACSGEMLVRMQLFTFVVSIMQHFTLHLETTETNGTTKKGTDFNEVYELKFKAIPRKTTVR